MFRLLDRYIIGQFVRLTILFTISTPALFILGDVTDNLDKFQARGLSAGAVAMGYVYQLPTFMVWSLPIAALIATVFTVNTMTRHSEVAAAKSGGVSFHRLFLWVPIMGVLLTLFGLALSELAPVADQKRAEVMGANRNSQTREDFVYRNQHGDVFEIRRLIPEANRIYGLAMEREGDEPDVPGRQLVARTAAFLPDSGWTLYDGYVRLFYGPGQERTMEFSSLRQPSFSEKPEDLLARPKEPEQMRFAELKRFIGILRRSGGKPLQLETELWQKIALPVASLVIVLFAAPLATSSRRGGAAYGVGISLAVTIVYLMLFKIAGAAGAAGTIDPLVAAWLPNAVFGAAGVVLMVRVRT